MSALGVGSSNPYLFLPVRLIFRHSNVNIGFKDHEAVEAFMKAEVEKGGVEWTGVKPVMLVEGEKRGVKVWGETGNGAGAMPNVTRRSVAGFLVDCVEGKNEEWVGKTPVISN